MKLLKGGVLLSTIILSSAHAKEIKLFSGEIQKFDEVRSTFRVDRDEREAWIDLIITPGNFGIRSEEVRIIEIRSRSIEFNRATREVIVDGEVCAKMTDFKFFNLKHSELVVSDRCQIVVERTNVRSGQTAQVKLAVLQR